MKGFADFRKTKEYLVCVDSDGCAMDTMDVKHFECFGPCMVDEWELSEWREEILSRWNDINLYTMTRGINRFRGLALALSEINEKYKSIDGIEELRSWADTAPELSNSAIEAMLAVGASPIFAKALSWSKAVNRGIGALPLEAKQPFPLVGEALERAHSFADVAIVSSANLDAVLEEWQTHGLVGSVDVIMTQNDGSKAHCIRKLVELGYARDKVLMCGDAPGDLDAADKCGVYFYPILVGRERESWEEFIKVGAERLETACYGGDYADKVRREFYKNLGN
ncbi:MAG: HAD hydrolase-like protein [Clostridia bacterium]|nr:HAD hydrolase-like protein [Clostridia bacterium]